MKKLRILFTLMVTLCLSVLLTSCARTTSSENWDLAAKEIDIIKAQSPENCPATAEGRNDTVIIGTSECNGVFNPLYNETAFDMNVTSLVFDGMVEADYNAVPIPGMADFQISADGLTYSFTLKDGLKFSNGIPVTAEDVEFTIYALCDPNYDGPYDSASIGIAGYEDYVTGDADSISGIKVLDEKNIQFTLEKPNGQAIWFFGVGILSKNYYGKDFERGHLETIKAFNDQPMGSGQYKLVEYNLGESLILAAHDTYWKGTPKIKNIIFSVTPPGQEVERLMTGEVDIDFPAVNQDTVNAAVNAGFIDIYRYPTNGYSYVGMNLIDDKYQDQKVRQALIYGLNRQAVVESVFGPYANVINIPQSRVSWAYDEAGINPYNFNLEKAAALLTEAGWEKDGSGKLTKDGRNFKITFSTSEGNPFTDVMIPVMQEDYGKLGIDIEFEYLDFMALIGKVLAGEADMWFLAWDLAADPDDGSYKSDGAQNLFSYANPEVDLLWEQGVKELDRSKRKEIYSQVYRKLNQDIPCIWLYQRSDMWLVNCRIKDFKVSPYRNWTYDMWQMEIQ
ncbi:MAG: ABC transporter substrate-binding protein [Dehalobacterium sp.]